MSVKKNIGYNILLTVSNMIFPIISFPYAARILGPEGTGEVNFAQSFCQYFIILSALGIPLYGIREVAKFNNNIPERSRLFMELSTIRLTTSLIVLIPYCIIVFTVSKFQSNIPLYLWGGFLILASSTSIEWFFSGLENFKYITLRSLLVKLISLVLLFLLVKERTDVIPYFFVYILTYLLNGFFNLKFASKFIEIRNIKWTELQLKKHLKPLTLIFSGLFATTVYVLLDTVMLGLIASDKAVGLYSAATKITKISLTVITSLGTVLVPKLSYAVSQNNTTEINRIIDRSIKFVLTFGIPMMSGLFILAPELIYLFSGDEFEAATITLRILCPLILIIGLANIFSLQILTPLSKDSLVMKAAIVGAVVSVFLNLILIPLWRENGSAITNIVAESIVTFVCFLFARRYVSFKISTKEIIYNLIATIPYWISAYLIRQITSNNFLIIGTTLVVALGSFFVLNVFVFKNSLILNTITSFRKKLNLTV